jgi:hypothetical protein
MYHAATSGTPGVLLSRVVVGVEANQCVRQLMLLLLLLTLCLLLLLQLLLLLL